MFWRCGGCDMEIVLKILPIILSFILPLLKNGLLSLKEDKKLTLKEIDNDLDVAEDFEFLVDDSYSQLYKDRYAKKIFNTKNINYDELVFFINFKDADVWVKRYLNVKREITKIEDDHGKITGFKSDSTFGAKVYWWVIYIVSMAFFATPYIFFNQYNQVIQRTITEQNYLMTVELFLFPILFLGIGIISLIQGGKTSEAKKFLKDLQTRTN